MPTYFRMMEVLSCSMMDFLPYILLVVYPFRNQTRLKSFLAGVLMLIITPALLYYDISCALLGTAPVGLPYPLLRSLILLVFSVLVIRTDIRKMLLNTCSVINLSILISALADRFAADYTVKHLMVTVLLQAILLAPYTLNLVYILAPTLNESDAKVWKLLFAAPAAGTVLGCILLLSGSSTPVAAMIAVLILSAVAAAAAVILTKTEMITLILKKDRPAKKETPVAVAAPAPAPVQRDTMQIYLSNLQKRMADAELGYKELLLQVMTMEDDLNNDDLEQLRSRLNTMRNQLAPNVDPTGIAQLDSVLTFYTRQAMLANVKLASSISLPEMSSVSDEDMTALMGCLMETAISACQEQTSGVRRIAAATHLDEDLLQIGVKFTYGESAAYDNDPLDICRSIVDRYDGRLAVIDLKGAIQIVASLHI